MKKPFAFLRRQSVHPESFVEWPFFLILTFAFGFVYVESVYSNPSVRQPARLVIFTLLIVATTALHWLSVRLRNWKQISAYLTVQGVLAFSIVFLGGNIGLLLGIYMGLVGEMVGLLREKPRWAVAAMIILLGLSFANYGLLAGWQGWYWWLLAMVPMTFFVVVYVTLYTRQAEARAQAQAFSRDLEAANRQLTEYAARVEDLTIASERQRMARELHDTLSQGLAGLILQLEAVDAHLEGGRAERARDIVRQAMEKARGTLAEARQAIDNLRHPSVLNLETAARLEAERFTAATGIPCHLELAVPGSLPDPVTEASIRAIAEGLTNIARHARATKSDLRIATMAKRNELEILIGDDGIGFNPDIIEAGHYGLLGMRERIRLAGGRLEVRSGAGQGSQLVIRFPLEKPADE